jgi:hypothetical protein
MLSEKEPIRKADNTYWWYAPLSAIVQEYCTTVSHVPQKNKETSSSGLSAVK